ncbi:DUF4235 domain-containing protein [Nesterenkonia lutea]|uniref:DUF4235 domain-containing protein n=1 Tax=Nesterenkonia lutea TaxID=272919 RepID=A0ABR9JBX9_9MICC|nr:DUF4235 domain-containing protein [Nesterenkonia lutea]MBE1523434.1 hypothetical protein [Nesterenkonia lutea]
MAKNESSNTAAKALYRPIGLLNSLISGAIAGAVFKKVWKLGSKNDGKDAPKALQSEFNLGEVLLAAAIQGAIFAFAKALVDRGGAWVFQRLTGEWPGD